MTERLDHEDGLPAIKLNLTDGALEMTPENSSLYMFLGRFACYSHVFVETQRTNDKSRIGTYIFSTHSVFSEISQFMASRGFPIHANLREVPDCDMKAFDDMIAQQTGDIGDTLPDGWGDGSQQT